MKRTMFAMGLPNNTSPFDGGMFAGIPVYDGKKDLDREQILQTLPVPPGMSVPYPYMVKVTGEGEYWVKSDGTTQHYSYKYGRWEPAEQTKKDLWYQMTHVD